MNQKRPNNVAGYLRTAVSNAKAAPQWIRSGGVRLGTKLSVHARLIVFASAVIYFFSLGSAAVLSHYGHKTQNADLRTMATSVWAASQGDLLMRHFGGAPNPKEGKSRLSTHANVIFIAFAPFYALFPTPVTLLLLTTFACVFAGLGIFVLARHFFGDSWITVLFPLAFWTSSLVHDANMYDFHVITFTAAFLVWALVMFEKERHVAAWVFFGLALLCKEDVALIGVFFGVCQILLRRRKTGAAVIAVSLVYAGIMMGWVMPTLAEDGHKIMNQRYGWLGKGVTGIITGALTAPGLVIEHLLNPQMMRLPLFLLLVGGIVALPGWRVLLLTLPHIAMGTLSNTQFITRFSGVYYWIVCEAVICIAILYATHYDRQRTGQIFVRRPVYLFVVTLLTSALLSPLPYSVRGRLYDYAPLEKGRMLALERVKEMIPEDASVAAQNNLTPHFANRKWINNLSSADMDSTDYIVYFAKYVSEYDLCLSAKTQVSYMLGGNPTQYFRHLQSTIKSSVWSLVYYDKQYYLFEKYAHDGLPARAALRQAIEDQKQFIQDRRRHLKRYKEQSTPIWNLCHVFT